MPPTTMTTTTTRPRPIGSTQGPHTSRHTYPHFQTCMLTNALRFDDDEDDDEDDDDDADHCLALWPIHH